MEIEKELARKTMEQMATLKKKYDSFVKDNGDALQRQQLDQYRVYIFNWRQILTYIPLHLSSLVAANVSKL